MPGKGAHKYERRVRMKGREEEKERGKGAHKYDRRRGRRRREGKKGRDMPGKGVSELTNMKGEAEGGREKERKGAGEVKGKKGKYARERSDWCIRVW